MQDPWEQLAIRSAAKGDTQAWALLYKNHVLAVHHYGLHLTGGRAELAEELTQETFVHAARGLHRFKPQAGNFRMWLLGIAKRRFLKIQTAEVRRTGREQRYAAEKPTYLCPPHEKTTSVHETLAQLPTQHRVVLEHKYLHGQSLKEIAAQLKITVEATESRLRRARQHFADVFQRITQEV